MQTSSLKYCLLYFIIIIDPDPHLKVINNYFKFSDNMQGDWILYITISTCYIENGLYLCDIVSDLWDVGSHIHL